MKKSLYPFIICLILSINAKAQVSQDFYDYFKSVIQSNLNSGIKNYASLLDASESCFNLTNKKYLDEISLYNKRKVTDSAAVELIPKQTIQRFLEQDYEKTFYPEKDKIVDVLDLFCKAICNNLTPKLAHLDQDQKNEQMSNLINQAVQETLADSSFLLLLKEKMSTHANDVQLIQKATDAYMFYHCPVLKKDLNEIPSFAAPYNDLHQLLTGQRFKISNGFAKNLGTNDIDDLMEFFIDKTHFDQFKDNLKSIKSKVELYQNGDKQDLIDWPNNSSITQTFAVANKSKEMDILFQLVYNYKQISTKIFVDNVTIISSDKIKNKEKIIRKLKNKLTPPGMIDADGKPAPPKPEENQEVH